MAKRILLSLAMVGGAVAVVVLLNAGRPAPERKAQEASAMLVEVKSVQSQTMRFQIASHGTVRPRTQTSLVAELAGTIVDVAPGFVAGGFFRRGDVLVQIDPSNYETAVRRAEAALASRQAQLAQERARAEQAGKDWTKLDRGNETPSDLVLRMPQLAEAEALVAAAQADLMKARRDLEKTRIRTPYDGMVREKRADVGQYVTPGSPVAVTFAIDRAEVRLPVPERELAFLDLNWIAGEGGDPPYAILRATLGAQEIARTVPIVRTEGVVDEATRVVYAVAEVDDPYAVLGRTDPADALPVGAFVDAAIEGRMAHDVVALPRHTLRPDGTVLIAGTDDRLEVRTVQVVRAERDLVYVGGGVRDGDRVILSSIQVPVPGAKLTIANDAEAIAQPVESTEPDAQGESSSETLTVQAGD